MSHPNDGFDPHDPKGGALADLPPVEPPSAGFIVQLFVIPAIVVLVVIAVWLLFGKLAGGERDAMEYVRIIRTPGAARRTAFRAAFELASLIQNDAKLSHDPRLLGELTDLLDHELDRGEDPQVAQYVALSLGEFQTLDARLSGGQRADPLATLARALAAKQPAAVRMAAATSLAKHAARRDAAIKDAAPIEALGEASKDGDPALRQLSAYALGFFGGPRPAQILRERLDDEDRFVRYNAAVALGRRGDGRAAPTFREMLSTSDLERAIPIESATEKRNKIEAIEREALHALESSVRGGRHGLAETLRPEIDRLAKSGLVAVRNDALALLRTMAGAEREAKPAARG